MPALDYCHPHIARALEKDGWALVETIRVATAMRTVYIDMEATRNINGASQRMVLAEIKCFPDRDSTTRELYTAIGQYLIYRTMLAENDVQIPLYLVVPEKVYDTIFDAIVRRVMNDHNIMILVVDIETEAAVRWIE